MRVLFCIKRHPRLALGQPRADRYVIHGSPPWPPPELNKSYFRVRLKTVVVRRNRSGAMQYGRGAFMSGSKVERRNSVSRRLAGTSRHARKSERHPGVVTG